MQLGPSGQPLHRRDGAPLDLDRQEKAAQLRLTVDEHRARAALAELAAVFGAGELHVLSQHLKKRLVHGEQHLRTLAVHVEGQNHPLDVAKHLVLHPSWSIAFRARAHSHRSGTTACARLEAGLGSSGYTRIVFIPSASAGSMSFSSRLPITTHRSGGLLATRMAISNTAGCGLSRPASTEVTIASTQSAIPSRRKSCQ